ncbi:MAG TPA: DsbA family protein [Candidatus Yaniella excrementigallinarum]|nr:DsbA family protein [Candidatus Yaniella excrementigallinarum]
MAKNKSAPSSRDAARQAHANQLAAEKRRSRIITWTIVGVVAAVIAIIVTVVLMNSSRSIPDDGPAPSSATSEGGIMYDKGVPVEADGPAEVDATTVDEPNPDTAGEVPDEVPDADASDIIIYADPNCVYCAQFEAENSEALDELAEDGYSIEYRIVNFLDNPGTDNYSSRAANAMACMAEEHPEHAGDFLHEIFDSYNSHQGAGLSNDELETMASDLGADISGCQSDNTYRPFVNFTTAKATAAGIAGTPSVWVNGEYYENTGDGESFSDWAKSQLED